MQKDNIALVLEHRPEHASKQNKWWDKKLPPIFITEQSTIHISWDSDFLYLLKQF